MIGEAVERALREAAYATDWVRDGALAMTAMDTHVYDLVLLDLGLPRRDGHEVLAHLRSKQDATGVLIVTARDALDERLRGLDGGLTTTSSSRSRWPNCSRACVRWSGASRARHTRS